MLKRLFVLIFSIIFLCGCTTSNKEEIVFSSWGSVTETKILAKIIDSFEVENPDIKINFMHIPQNYFQKIHLLFASKTPPDVLFINNLYLPIYENCLIDLTDFLSDKEEFFPQAIEGLSVNNKILAIPRDISNQVFYVNLDLVNLEKEEMSLEDFLHISQEVAKKNIFAVSHEKDIYWALPYLRAFGGGVLDKNLNLIIDDEKSQNGLNFYNDLVKKYKVAPSKSQVGSLTQAQMFLDGKIAFYLSGRWMYPIISEKADFNWKVIPFPKGELSQLYDTSGWAISKDSKHIEASKKFVKYLSSEESSEYFTKTGLIIPARKKSSKLLNNEEHNEKVFIEIIDSLEKTSVNKNYRKILDKINLTFLNN